MVLLVHPADHLVHQDQTASRELYRAVHLGADHPQEPFRAADHQGEHLFREFHLQQVAGQLLGVARHPDRLDQLQDVRLQDLMTTTPVSQ